MIIRDPIASLDQVVAQIHRWSVIIGTMRDALMCEGFGEDKATEIARDWMEVLIDHAIDDA